MIQENYSASCFVEYKDGEYYIESDIWTDGKEAYAAYTGTSFVDGVNAIVDELTEALAEQEESDTNKGEPVKSLEQHIEILTQQIEDLRKENANLLKQLNNQKAADEDEYSLNSLLNQVAADLYKNYKDSLYKTMN